MPAVLIAGPAAEPVSIAELRAHLRLAAGEDALSASLIAAARMTVEQQSGLRLMTQSWRVLLDDWPQGVCELPVAPVQAVTSVKLPGDPEHALAASDYRLQTNLLPPQIRFLGNHLPRPQQPECGIHINLTVGFGPAAADVPDDLRLAVLQLAAHWYDADEFSRAGRTPVMPPHIAALVNARRLRRLG